MLFWVRDGIEPFLLSICLYLWLLFSVIEFVKEREFWFPLLSDSTLDVFGCMI